MKAQLAQIEIQKQSVKKNIEVKKGQVRTAKGQARAAKELDAHTKETKKKEDDK